MAELKFRKNSKDDKQWSDYEIKIHQCEDLILEALEINDIEVNVGMNCMLCIVLRGFIAEGEPFESFSNIAKEIWKIEEKRGL